MSAYHTQVLILAGVAVVLGQGAGYGLWYLDRVATGKPSVGAACAAAAMAAILALSALLTYWHP